MSRNSKSRRDAKKRKRLAQKSNREGAARAALTSSGCHNTAYQSRDTKLHCEPADGMPVEEFVLRNVSCSFHCQHGMRWAARFQTEYASRVSRDFFRGDAPLCVEPCGFLGHLVDTLKHRNVVLVESESEPVLQFFVTTDDCGETCPTPRLQVIETNGLS